MNSMECSGLKWVWLWRVLGVCLRIFDLAMTPSFIARLVQIKHVHGIIGHVCGNGIVPTVQYYNSST